MNTVDYVIIGVFLIAVIALCYWDFKKTKQEMKNYRRFYDAE